MSEEAVQSGQDRGDAISAAVAEGGTYELLRSRLLTQVDALQANVGDLNQARQELFGSTALEVAARVRVRTENNCVPRDIVRVGNYLLFGYNVFIGLKKETEVSDVFALYELHQQETGIEISPTAAHFLSDDRFLRDFRDLYAYYKDAHLARMQVLGSELYVTFRIGENIDDVRVFHWHVDESGAGSEGGAAITYVDDRAERSVPRPARHDFDWILCGRDDLVTRAGTATYSLQDRLFVEIHRGELRFKVEDNTPSGASLLSERVEEPNQTLDDADIAFAQQAGLLIVRATPYTEQTTRYYIFDPLTDNFERHDEIGIALRELPEDHGVIFPGGYYLGGIGSKRFEDDVTGLSFSRQMRSPNGEDVLFVFYEPGAGRYGLYAYNLIRKSLENPIYANGYSLFPDGTLVIFKAESADPTRNHPMQIWQTAFFDDEHVVETTADTPLAKIGNQELVRGISDLIGIGQAAQSEQVTVASYNALIQTCTRVRDNYYWIQDEFTDIAKDLAAIAETAELVLDEFEKIAEIRSHANHALREAEQQQRQLIREINTSDWHHARDFVRALGELRQQRGHLMTLKETRYIDLPAIEVMETEIVTVHDDLAERTVGFLMRDDALEPYRKSLDDYMAQLDSGNNSGEIKPVQAGLDSLGEELDLLTEVLGSLAVDDAVKRTTILESISELFGLLNAGKARVRNKLSNLGGEEAKAEFAAQFALFSQSVTNALGQADTPQACDEQMARLTLTLEELEGRFGAYDEFLPDIFAKREELRDAFETLRQSLVDQRERRAENLHTAALRMLDGIRKRAERCTSVDELNTHFSTDTMVVKLKDTMQALREIDDAVKADDLDARLKAAQDASVRGLRDKQDIFEDGGNIIKLGQHRFSVNQQSLELTIIPREGKLQAQLTGTGFSEPLTDEALLEYRPFWTQSLVSETDAVYRAEYLAADIIFRAQQDDGISWAELQQSLTDGSSALPQREAAARYTEGYEKGVHDHDAQLILSKVVPCLEQLDLLQYAPSVRALALLFWLSLDDPKQQATWRARAHTAAQLGRLFPAKQPFARMVAEVHGALTEFADLALGREASQDAARYLVEELAREDLSLTISQKAHDLKELLQNQLRDQNFDRRFADSLAQVEDLATRFHIATQWLTAVAEARQPALARNAEEAAVYLLMGDQQPVQVRSADTHVSVKGLLGQHVRIANDTLELEVDEFISRLHHFRETQVPAYHAFQALRSTTADHLREELRLDDFEPKPLASFVRNKLLNEVYLPIIGANLAKQLGAADDAKRTDLMGLLLLISPPGYGKTTLMEYVASRLGLIFVKVNGPALGHSVSSVDPSQAPNATARQELEKLNLAFEMGNNVMLYLDDIQHTHPEFLQKFISLCDGTRRIEGVWRGEPKTYDLRGKRFCVIMAGNPYTESGDVFQIPDMLANRADVYNLGDVLSGRESVFALSYIENSLTSNPVLAPLATRDMDDVYRFVDRAAGKTVADTDFGHSYSGAEANEIVSVLQKMQTIQSLVLAVNQEYIRSAATDDQFRTEPPFKLQGSYRNMNKLAEKVLPIMNEDEIQALLDDHYAGESQLLTGEAEFNVLRLAELRDRLTAQQSQRLAEIRADYRRSQSMGGRDADAGTKLANQLAHIRDAVAQISSGGEGSGVTEQLAALTQTIQQAELTIVNQPSKVVEEAMQNLANTIETTFMPVVVSMDKKIDLDLAILRRINELNDNLNDVIEDADPDAAEP